MACWLSGIFCIAVYINYLCKLYEEKMDIDSKKSLTTVLIKQKTGYYNLSQSVKETEHSNDLSKNLYLICNDRIHRIILRLKPIMSVLLVKSLNGC